MEGEGVGGGIQNGEDTERSHWHLGSAFEVRQRTQELTVYRPSGQVLGKSAACEPQILTLGLIVSHNGNALELCVFA